MAYHNVSMLPSKLDDNCTAPVLLPHNFVFEQVAKPVVVFVMKSDNTSIIAELVGLGLSLNIALFVHLYLADMAHFGAANTAYCRHFPAVSPSARACVQAQLPSGCPVTLEVLLPSSIQGESLLNAVAVHRLDNGFLLHLQLALLLTARAGLTRFCL